MSFGLKNIQSNGKLLFPELNFLLAGLLFFGTIFLTLCLPELFYGTKANKIYLEKEKTWNKWTIYHDKWNYLYSLEKVEQNDSKRLSLGQDMDSILSVMKQLEVEKDTLEVQLKKQKIIKFNF